MRVTLSERQAKFSCWIALLLIGAIYWTFANFSNLPRAPSSFLCASYPSTAATTYTVHSFANSITNSATKMSNIVHVVLFEFKPETSPETVLDVHWLFSGLSFDA